MDCRVLNLGDCSPFSSLTSVTLPMSAAWASASWVSPADSPETADSFPEGLPPHCGYWLQTVGLYDASQ